VGRAKTASPLVSRSSAAAAVDVIGRGQFNSYRRVEDGQGHALSWALPEYGADLGGIRMRAGNRAKSGRSELKGAVLAVGWSSRGLLAAPLHQMVADSDQTMSPV
jgi:hypothetical protein